MKIVQQAFPKDQYFPVQTFKSQVTIHHTVSSPGVLNDIAWWAKETSRIGTAYIIGHDGTIHQLFNQSHWGHHLGVSMRGNKIASKFKTQAHNLWLNKSSVAIELDSAGPVKLGPKGYYSTFGAPVKNVTKYPNKFRGYDAFESYTDAQIEALKELLLMLCAQFKIPTQYDPGIWDISERALQGKAGIFTHVSYRTDKSDCHPQPSLIEMLKSLSI